MNNMLFYEYHSIPTAPPPHLMIISTLLLFLSSARRTDALATPYSRLTPLDVDRMTAQVFINSGVEFGATGPQCHVSSVLASVSWYPRCSFSQNVVKFDMLPPPAKLSPEEDAEIVPSSKNLDIDDEDEDYISLCWNQPGMYASFDLKAVIETTNEFVRIGRRVPFPMIPESVPFHIFENYVERECKYADITPELQRLAQSLVYNTSYNFDNEFNNGTYADGYDLFQAVFQIADWIHSNIRYSLVSMGLPQIQTATQVLASRYGKCDEMSALFVSLCRAVGIPARFVSGWAYTDNDQLFDEPWGGHVWAEVYFPNLDDVDDGGIWVPFDVTYGQLGFLDAGHVLLQTSADVVESNVEYSAQGLDFQCLRPEPLHCVVQPQPNQYKVSPSRTRPLIDITLEAPIDRIGFGSAVVILATIRNNEDYYVATRLDLGKTEYTGVLNNINFNWEGGNGRGKSRKENDEKMLVLLEPYSIQTIPIVLQIFPNSQQSSQYIYQFPFMLISNLAGKPQGETIIQVGGRDAPMYDPADCFHPIDGSIIIPGSYAEEEEQIFADPRQLPYGSAPSLELYGQQQSVDRDNDFWMNIQRPKYGHPIAMSPPPLLVENEDERGQFYNYYSPILAYPRLQAEGSGNGYDDDLVAGDGESSKRYYYTSPLRKLPYFEKSKRRPNLTVQFNHAQKTNIVSKQQPQNFASPPQQQQPPSYEQYQQQQQQQQQDYQRNPNFYIPPSSEYYDNTE